MAVPGGIGPASGERGGAVTSYRIETGPYGRALVALANGALKSSHWG